jgi:hypothetical protein
VTRDGASSNQSITAAGGAPAQVWNVFRMEWEQFHNTGEWRAVKDVSVELSEPMLLSPALLASRPHAGAEYLRQLLWLRLSLAFVAAKERMRSWVVGSPETQELESLSGEASQTTRSAGAASPGRQMSPLRRGGVNQGLSPLRIGTDQGMSPLRRGVNQGMSPPSLGTDPRISPLRRGGGNQGTSPLRRTPLETPRVGGRPEAEYFCDSDSASSADSASDGRDGAQAPPRSMLGDDAATGLGVDEHGVGARRDGVGGPALGSRLSCDGSRLSCDGEV